MSQEPSAPKPPVFRTWRGWYLLLAAFTAAQFIIYWLLTNRLNHPF